MSKKFLIIFLLLLISACFLRFYELDERPNHHDESVHAHFTHKLWKDGYYEGYNPMWHGPFLYYLSASFFHLFGDSDFTSRSTSAIFGTALVTLCFFLKGYIGERGALFTAFFLTFSPSFLYYSRFFRLDLWVAFFSLALLLSIFQYLKSKNGIFLYLAAFFAALAVVAKENSYILLFIFLTFSIPYLAKNIRKFFDVFPVKNILVSSAIFFFVYYIFYSAFFSYPEDPFFAFFKSVGYWGTYAKGPTGPYYFYIALSLLYELPLLIFGTCAIILYNEKIHPFILSIFRVSILFSLLLIPVAILSQIFNSYLFLLSQSFFQAIFYLILFSGILTLLYNYNPKFLNFLSYWALLSILIYSSIYEKAPWLLPHILLPFAILAGKFLDEKRRWNIPAIFLSFLLVYTSMNLCYFHYSDPAEPLLQAAQPSAEFRELLRKIDEVALLHDGYATKIQIARIGTHESEHISGTQTTQFLWYLRKYTNLSWGVYPEQLDAPLIIAHLSYADIIEENLIGYKRMDASAMGWYWWKPEDFFSLEYYFFRSMDREPDGDRLSLFYKDE